MGDERGKAIMRGLMKAVRLGDSHNDVIHNAACLLTAECIRAELRGEHLTPAEHQERTDND
jgi:hypothetical protein